jgi:hypothetical protein
MAPGPRDLLIHYDEAAGELVVHPVPVDAAGPWRQAHPAGVPVSLELIRELAPELAEQHLGGMLFAMIDHHATHPIGVRDYAGEIAREQARHVAELEALAATGDADAQYELFGQMQMRAWKELSRTHLDRADALLAAAVAQGHEEAMAMAVRWPVIKSVAERRIDGGAPA